MDDIYTDVQVNPPYQPFHILSTPYFNIDNRSFQIKDILTNKKIKKSKYNNDKLMEGGKDNQYNPKKGEVDDFKTMKLPDNGPIKMKNKLKIKQTSEKKKSVEELINEFNDAKKIMDNLQKQIDNVKKSKNKKNKGKKEKKNSKEKSLKKEKKLKIKELKEELNSLINELETQQEDMNIDNTNTDKDRNEKLSEFDSLI